MTDSLVHPTAPPDLAPAAGPTLHRPPDSTGADGTREVGHDATRVERVGDPDRDDGAAVVGAVAATDPVTDDGEAAGLGRALVLGGLVGFLVVYLLAFAMLAAVTDYGVAAAAGAAVFVGLFGGIGFGAMVGASLHR